MSGPALIALTAAGELLARRLQPVLPGSAVHGLQTRTTAPDVPFADTGPHLRKLFEAGVPIVGIAAAGILIRLVAPAIADKRSEPPMIAIAEDGSAVVPLLGGHRGANRLARVLADFLGIKAAVTTAGDVGLGFALDDPPSGWAVGNRQAAKAIAAALLAGEPVALLLDDGVDADLDWLRATGAAFSNDPALRPAVRVTHRIETAEDIFVLHPRSLGLGVGCERGCDPKELQALALAAMRGAGLSDKSVACVASLDLKSDEAAVVQLAASLSVPARFFDAATLEAETPRLANPSEIVFAEVGCHGVAEGAALAATGPFGQLLVPKLKSARATVALAQAPKPIDATMIGQARGRLSIVGIGPGAAAWRTPEATAMLQAATDVVGYGLYLDLLGGLIAGKARHQSQLSEEEARVRIALDLAATGRNVALVSSGDAGIYAMAALAFELLERDNDPAWNRIDIAVAPGISAVQAAAARIGAPLGHDFALISLSDLLTPFAVIERRIKAAAEGDFVVAFYNPVSKRRRTQLAAAKEILLKARPPETPVVLARNLGRLGERVDVIRLADLDVDDVDMLTLVLVGASATRHIRQAQREWVYTPRGYAAKLGGA
ncbi:MAG: precorrin-3B C(17)-methyltransferase [Proteobacteria bacterium]|nr:precorrin-3B C(17)-methyltransferase [Pseudomonadota bacterium]